jgi:hypothetical protein
MGNENRYSRHNLKREEGTELGCPKSPCRKEEKNAEVIQTNLFKESE